MVVLPLPIGDNLRLRGVPWLTYFLALASLVVFTCLRYFFPEAASCWVQNVGLRPAEFLVLGEQLMAKPGLLYTAPMGFLRGGLAPLFGHMGIHAAEVHVLGTVFFLLLFGRGLERRLGRIRFFVIYCLCGLTGATLHLWLNPASSQPMVGSSGAVAGVIGAFLLLYPGAKIRLILWFIVPLRAEVPAIVFVIIWFLFTLVISQNTTLAIAGTCDVAYAAHCGAFFMGCCLSLILRLGRPGKCSPGAS